MSSYINKIIKDCMKSKSVPVQEMLLKQIISEAGIVKKEHKQGLKKYFDKRFAQQINLMQYHRLREDRFIQSQKRVLEKQNYSIQKAKEYIELRQQKASSNKVHSIIQKSKRVEEDLFKWEKRMEINRQEEEKRLNQSSKLISHWNDKLSESSSRKNNRINNLSHMLHEKTADKILHAENSRRRLEELRLQMIQDPQQSSNEDSRYKLKEHSRLTHRNSRISTESLFDRRNKQEEDLLEKSLIQTGQKQEKINEARFMKQYMFDRKKKLKHEKEESQRLRRQQRLNQLKESIEARNQTLDKKFEIGVKNRHKRTSLPLVSVHKASNNLFLNGPGEQWRSKKKLKDSSPSYLNSPENETSLRILEPNYSKLVREKIHDIAHIMRKNRA